jgi:hypothetical protein
MHGPYTDAVLLVPGFLGFSRLGSFYYFGERVIATLRGALEGRARRPVPVVPVDTMPTGTLAERQEALLQAMKRLSGAGELGPEARFHLVGHSTGGLDSELVTHARPLDLRWEGLHRELVPRISSVATVAAPLLGSTLADTPLARALADVRRLPALLGANLPESLRLVLEVAGLVPRDLAAATGLATLKLPDAASFVLQVLEDHKLIGDLLPARMAEIRQKVGERYLVDGLPITCFVTAARLAADADAFFRHVYELTAASARQHPWGPGDRRLEDLDPSLVVASQEVAPPPRAIEASDNDGIVNSRSQLLPGATLGGVVVADHADVMGHYDRMDELVDQRTLNAGLFHSGSHFGDDEFFALYGRIARALPLGVPGVKGNA